jgi:uncharacterized membrane protein (DUF4010 family)
MSPIGIMLFAIAGLLGLAIAKVETESGATSRLLVWAFVVMTALAFLASCTGIIDLD